jgi:hypothetical protein
MSWASCTSPLPTWRPMYWSLSIAAQSRHMSELDTFLKVSPAGGKQSAGRDRMTVDVSHVGAESGYAEPGGCDGACQDKILAEQRRFGCNAVRPRSRPLTYRSAVHCTWSSSDRRLGPASKVSSLADLANHVPSAHNPALLAIRICDADRCGDCGVGGRRRGLAFARHTVKLDLIVSGMQQAW